jgi:DNA-binding CsgD family transcriptional regulator
MQYVTRNDGSAPVISRAPADSARSEQPAPFGLTHRELEVAQLLRLRRSNTELASTLGISEHTARHHTENVLAKLGLHSRMQVEEHVIWLALEPSVAPASRRAPQ